MKKELAKIIAEYPTPRLSDIRDEIKEIKIDTNMMIPKEDVIVSLTKDGYIKRTSKRSYNASTETILEQNPEISLPISEGEKIVLYRQRVEE